MIGAVLVAVAVAQAAGDTPLVGNTHTPSAVLTPTATATVISAVAIKVGTPAPFTGVLLQPDHLAYIVSIAAEKQNTPRKPLWYEAAGCLSQSLISGFLIYKEAKK